MKPTTHECDMDERERMTRKASAHARQNESDMQRVHACKRMQMCK